MIPNAEQLLNKGKRALRAAETLLKGGDFDFSVSRAYYAMFYAAEAALLSKKISTSKHSGVISLLYEHFVKPGKLDKSLHQTLHEAFDLRQQGDYWSDSGISEETAQDLLKKARLFVATIENILR